MLEAIRKFGANICLGSYRLPRGPRVQAGTQGRWRSTCPQCGKMVFILNKGVKGEAGSDRIGRHIYA